MTDKKTKITDPRTLNEFYDSLSHDLSQLHTHPKTVDRSENKDYLYTENSDINQKDMVNHPEHYNKGKYETYDVIVDTLGKDEAMSYCQGNVLKYIMRMWNKNKPLQDAEKAEWYLKAMIKLLKETKGVNW